MWPACREAEGRRSARQAWLFRLRHMRPPTMCGQVPPVRSGGFGCAREAVADVPRVNIRP